MTSTQLDAAKFLINKRMPNPPEERNLNLSGQGRLDVQVRLVNAEARR